MKTFLFRRRVRLWMAVSVALCLGGLFCSRAATREEFGYRAWNPPSPWNLLLVVVTYADTTYSPNLLSTLDQTVFGPGTSVAGFFQENSRGRLTYQKAGTVLVNLPANERYTNWVATVGTNAALTVYFSNFVSKAFSAAGLNLADYDKNPADNEVTQGELDIVILSPPGEGAFSQPGVSVPQSASGRTWRGYALGMEHNTTMATIVHELGHHCQAYAAGWEYLNWGNAIDLYGRWNSKRVGGGTECLNSLLTVMGCSGVTSIHFDGWEKMRFGWFDPRIYSLTDNRMVSISAAQLNDSSGPVVLYDPNRGPSEYFLLEYRTPHCSNGSIYDQDVAGTGLVIWHVQLDADTNYLWLADAVLPTNSQTNWWWCTNCYGMFYSETSPVGAGGVCAGGGAHQSQTGSRDYRLPFSSAGVAGEDNWNYCYKCRMLFYGPNMAASHCPKGGAHSNTGSGNYTALDNGLPLYPRWNQADAPWRRCNKCQSLFNANSNETNTNCPAGGTGLHDDAGSPAYDFQMRMQRVSIGALGAPDLLFGSNAQWTNGTCTPVLRWYDGSPTSTQIYVHPSEPGADSIVVEWGAMAEAWVDFAYLGAPFFPEWGTFAQPYNTVPEAATAVRPGGTVRIKAGHTAAGALITRPLRLESYGGTAIIGQ